MKQDKFLTGILIGVGVLIVLALFLFFTRQEDKEYKAENTPDGVVHNYVLAILNKDYEKAYGYLADLENKPTYQEFRQSFLNGYVNSESAGVEIGEVQIINNDAYVDLIVHYSYNDPFSSSSGSTETATLVKQNGAWKISVMPYYFWDYNWYQDY